MPSRSQMAASLIGWCVPSAMRMSKLRVTDPICRCSAWNTRSTGAVRVPSGTINSTRLSLYEEGRHVCATTDATCSAVTWPPGRAISEITALDCIEELCLRSSETKSRHRRECRRLSRNRWLSNWPEKLPLQLILQLRRSDPSGCGPK